MTVIPRFAASPAPAVAFPGLLADAQIPGFDLPSQKASFMTRMKIQAVRGSSLNGLAGAARRAGFDPIESEASPSPLDRDRFGF